MPMRCEKCNGEVGFAFSNCTCQNLSESIDTPGSVCETAHKEENRCCACGCFMEGFDCSTEAREDYDFRCNNKKCPSNNRLK